MVVREGRFSIGNNAYETDEIFELDNGELERQSIKDLLKEGKISYLTEIIKEVE